MLPVLRVIWQGFQQHTEGGGGGNYTLWLKYQHRKLQYKLNNCGWENVVKSTKYNIYIYSNFKSNVKFKECFEL